MLTELIDFKFNSNCLIIEDSEEAGGQDLFVTCLKNHAENNTGDKINLLCYENPPQFYLSKVMNSKDEKIILHNFFEDPCGWNNESRESFDLNYFISNLSEAVIFIDSLSFLTEYYGFNAVYKNLNCLKKIAKKVICLVHGDNMSALHLRDLKQLSSSFVKFESCSDNSVFSKERVVDVYYKKINGKIINQKEIMFINEDFQVCSHVKKEAKPLKTVDAKSKIKNLTTFKLGIELSENERKAKNQLTLPYLRAEQNTVGKGDIIYYPDPEDDMEDDPDDDLDI